ncbi:hypothetical protein PRIPAC_76385, partial [Pristionchus pacificus]
ASTARMEECVRLSSDDLRSQLQEERANFAEKQKVLLEAKSKINRGKLSSVSSVTEKSLNVFLRSCCEETEKEQAYVSNVIERVRITATHTKNSLEKVSQHGQKLLKNVHSDVVELSENLQRVRSGQTTLSSILERRDARGCALRERRDDTLRSLTFQFDWVGKVFNKIESRIDSKIVQLKTHVAESEQMAKVIDMEVFTIEQELEQGESAMLTHKSDVQAVQDQLRKTAAEYDQLQNQLTNRNKAKECAESDQASIEMEVTELRESTRKMFEEVSAKVASVEENKLQINLLSTSIAELNDVILATETDVHKLGKTLSDLEESSKINSDEVVQSLEREVEDVCNELSADAIRADVMDNMFGSEINITPEEWRASIENAITVENSNNEFSGSHSSLLMELEAAKTELEKALQDQKNEQEEHDASQSRMRNLKKRIDEDQESRDENLRMVESRIEEAMKELEELTNAKCSEATEAVVTDAIPTDAAANDAVAADAIASKAVADSFVTPNPARHSSLQDLRKASVEASRIISDDSDVESVKKSVIDLPEGIVKRNAATQQCSIVRSPDESFIEPADELAAIADNVDGDATMEGIPLSASIDHALVDDKVGNWIRTTPDSVSPGSGTTAEMMEDRFPTNIFNETNALNETDITMDMEDGELNLSMMEMPTATSNKTLSPPPVRQSSSKASIFMNDSDSDANASVWGDDF